MQLTKEFVCVKPFQPCLVFVGKAVANLSGAPVKAPGLAHKNKARLEWLAMEKHSLLLQKIVNYGCKEFLNIDLGVISIEIGQK